MKKLSADIHGDYETNKDIGDDAVYLASEVDALLAKIRVARREGWYEEDPSWAEIDKELGL